MIFPNHGVFSAGRCLTPPGASLRHRATATASSGLDDWKDMIESTIMWWKAEVRVACVACDPWVPGTRSATQTHLASIYNLRGLEYGLMTPSPKGKLNTLFERLAGKCTLPYTFLKNCIFGEEVGFNYIDANGCTRAVCTKRGCFLHKFHTGNPPKKYHRLVQTTLVHTFASI